MFDFVENYLNFDEMIESVVDENVKYVIPLRACDT